MRVETTKPGVVQLSRIDFVDLEAEQNSVDGEQKINPVAQMCSKFNQDLGRRTPR